jgi:hypothetical protein
VDAIDKMQHRKRIDIGIVVALDDVEVRRDKSKHRAKRQWAAWRVISAFSRLTTGVGIMAKRREIPWLRLKKRNIPLTI